MSTKTFDVTKQMMVSNNTGDANPGDLHIPIGRWAAGTGLSWNGRATLYAPVSFAGVSSLTEARLYLKAHWASGWHAHGTSTATIKAYRKTADWSETSHGGPSTVDEIWGSNGTSVTNSGYGSNPGGNNSFGNLTEGNWYYITITEIVQAWMDGYNNYGVLLINDTSETNDAYGKEFYSRHSSGDKPYIWISYSTNSPPNAPTDLSPDGGQVLNDGRSVTFSLRHSDPDNNDTPINAQYKVYKNDGTTLIDDWTDPRSTGPTREYTRTLPSGTPTNTFYKWKARTKDEAGEWGPYSTLKQFKINTQPNTPTGRDVTTDSLTPQFSGSLSDPDASDSVTAVQIQVQPNGGGTDLWASSDLAVSGATFTKSYAGSALSYNTPYEWRVRSKDGNGCYSSWSTWLDFIIEQPVGPTQSPRTTTAGLSYGGKINDTTPDLTMTYGENFEDHEIYLYSDENGSNLVFSSTPVAYAATSSKVVTCTATLSAGTIYYWKARVFVTSSQTWTGWAGVSQSTGKITSKFYVNALPTAPTNVLARTSAGADAKMSAGTYIVASRVPQLEALFNDNDITTYGDAPSARSIEIYNNTTGASVHTNENLTPGYTVPMRYFPGTISGANTTLAALAAESATNIKVTSVTSMSIGDTLLIGPAGSAVEEAVTIVTVGTAGSGGTGVTITPALTYQHANAEAVREIVPVLSYETTYKMRWRFQDNSDTYGSWSSYVKFKPSEPSTVASLLPSGTVGSPSFTATWNHSSPGGKAQGLYHLLIMRTSDEEVVYDSGWQTSSVESHVVPNGYLQMGVGYTMTLEVFDTEGL